MSDNGEFNRQYFSKADVAAGLHIKLIDFLLSNFESKEYRLDLRAYHDDCGAIVVEWVRALWNEEDEMGKFAFVGADEYVMQEVQFPDGHYDYAHSDEEAEELLEHWKKTHKKAKDTNE